MLGPIRTARSGRSAALAVQGEAGIGKTARLDYLVDAATGCRVLRAAGVESEMELAFAGLHQLCNPLLDGLDGLPAPQAEALGTAFGIRAGTPPDRFVIGLGVLTLLSDHVEDQPLVCVIDDAQWLDQASAEILTFVARRLAAESILMVFAARATGEEQAWAGLPRLMVHGLKKADAVAVLESVVTTPLDGRLRDRILAETRGNPLVLLELPRWMSSAELTFGPEQAAAGSVAGRVEERFRRRLDPLPDETRRLLLIAATEPLGDVGLLWRAAQRLGLGPDAATPAEAAELIDVWDTVRFRHPLVRSAVYRSAGPLDRQAAHRALAEATDPDRDPDRLAWHRAHAASGPDETVAAELERCADRALAHGGLAAGAAFLERAARLTPDEAGRVERELKAAQTMLHAGAFEDALRLLALLEHRALTELQRARAEVLRAQIAFASNRGHEALPLLLAAARRLEPLDVELAADETSRSGVPDRSALRRGRAAVLGARRCDRLRRMGPARLERDRRPAPRVHARGRGSERAAVRTEQRDLPAPVRWRSRHRGRPPRRGRSARGGGRNHAASVWGDRSGGLPRRPAARRPAHRGRQGRCPQPWRGTRPRADVLGQRGDVQRQRRLSVGARALPRPPSRPTR
ncbi:AAA family ATPase [Jiangella ureilytica]|uniref:AAA family ATPase n=1 Tax=Jiangella ureilytica TaxID=2530374 RepID=UPI00193EAC3E